MSGRLRVHGLRKAFGGDAPALDGVELTVEPGKLTVVRGAPGSGRSVLLRCLAGVYRSDGGTVRLHVGDEALDVGSAPARTVAWLRAEHLDLVGGHLRSAPREPALAAAARPLELAGVPAAAARARARVLLDGLGLSRLIDMPVGLLPAPARRAVAVGRALLCPPGVLLLDEPALGLDARAQAQIAELLEGARGAGRGVLATTAPGEPLEALADHTLTLDRGRIE